MKKFAIVLMSLCLLFASGCQEDKQSSNETKLSKKLPPEIAGTWQAVEWPWRISLSEDGTVSAVVISMGSVEIKPNQTTRFEMKDGQFSTIKAGDCITEYDPQNRELYVSVDVNDINIVFFDEELKGHSQSYFLGPVSEDGKWWDVSFIEEFDYGPRFPQDPCDIVSQPMLFKKIEVEKAQ